MSDSGKGVRGEGIEIELAWVLRKVFPNWGGVWAHQGFPSDVKDLLNGFSEAVEVVLNQSLFLTDILS